MNVCCMVLHICLNSRDKPQHTLEAHNIPWRNHCSYLVNSRPEHKQRVSMIYSQYSLGTEVYLATLSVIQDSKQPYQAHTSHVNNLRSQLVTYRLRLSQSWTGWEPRWERRKMRV